MNRAPKSRQICLRGGGYSASIAVPVPAGLAHGDDERTDVSADRWMGFGCSVVRPRTMSLLRRAETPSRCREKKAIVRPAWVTATSNPSRREQRVGPVRRSFEALR